MLVSEMGKSVGFAQPYPIKNSQGGGYIYRDRRLNQLCLTVLHGKIVVQRNGQNQVVTGHLNLQAGDDVQV